MGFLDFIFGGSEETQLKRHAKKVNNLNAQADERLASAQWLAENQSDDAIAALLKRFSLTYEQRMKDSDEKQMIYQLLESIGPQVAPATKAWMKRNDQFAIPLGLIAHFEGEEAKVSSLLELLGLEIDPFKPKKKEQILLHLAKSKDQRIVERVPFCLKDFDEGVRYAAVEALAAQENDDCREPLAEALSNPNEESNRFRCRIAEIFHQRKWSLGQEASLVAENPPTQFQVVGDKIQPT